MAQSGVLKLCGCWSLFGLGALTEARDQLQTLADLQGHANYRNLQIHLAIAIGDWESLSAMIEAEYQARERRDWRELLGAAQLAIALGSSRAKALTFAAAEKVENDAEALVALHTLALKAGWDGEPQVATWLQHAAALSGADGPVRAITLPNLVDELPKWEEQQANVLEKLEARRSAHVCSGRRPESLTFQRDASARIGERLGERPPPATPRSSVQR